MIQYNSLNVKLSNSQVNKLKSAINDTTIYAEKMYSPNFTVDNKIFCLSLHYNDDNSYLFANGKKVNKFKAKTSELIKYPMCLGGLSKDYTEDNRKDKGLYRNVYDFSVDYSAISNDKKDLQARESR